MITFQKAREIAEKVIQSHPYMSDDKLVILDDQILEKPYAWIFPYTSERWLKGDLNFAIGGNSPIFVDKEDGKISTFRSGLSIEGMIEEYEEKNKLWELRVSSETYSDLKKLSALKAHLNIIQAELHLLKTNNVIIVAVGGKSRLDQLAELMKLSGIDGEVKLTNS